jgi:putative ABC transport system ATP-binding protein
VSAIQLKGLYKIYKDGEVETVALRGVDLALEPGQFVAISGRSGAGKSTLLNIIGGLTLPSAGSVLIHGQDITRMNEGQRARYRREKVGVVYQGDNLIPFLDALENVMLPMQLAGRNDASARSRLLLEEVGLSDRLHHRPAMLSGGERQRVAIAVALANQPEVFLADELTGELDSGTAAVVMGLLRDLNGTRELTLLVVTHNKNVASYAHRQVVMSDGQLFEDETVYA